MKEELYKIFTPQAPIRQKDIFSGRQEERTRFFRAMQIPGAQVVIYGDRGVGKTSFANITSQSVKDREAITISCSRLNFEEIFEKIFSKLNIPISQKIEQKNEFNGSLNILGAISHGKKGTKIESKEYVPQSYDVEHIIQVFERLEKLGIYFLLILDEFDAIKSDQSEETKTEISHLIKSFSDRLSMTKLVLVGIANSLDDLVSNHLSNARAITEISLERMPEKDLRQIIAKGESKLGVSFSPGLIEKIVTLSEGFPFFVHLLCLGVMENFYNNKEKGDIVQESLFTVAIEYAYQEANHTLKKRYENITRIENQKFVMWACAENLQETLIKRDQLNSKVEAISGTPPYDQTIQALITKEVLEKVQKGYYQFKDPLMKIFCNIARKKEPNQSSFFPS